MKILMITSDHLMIDRRILQEASSLIRRGYEVTLLAGFECPKAESYEADGIKIHRFSYDWSDSRFRTLVERFSLTPGGKTYSIAWNIFRVWANRIARITSFEQFILDRLFEYQVDILHVHDFPMLAPGVELARIRGVPLIYDAHELYYAQTQLPKKTQRKYKHREAKLIHNADAVITVNPYIVKLMAERYKIEKEPYVILNAAPLQAVEKSNLLHKRFDLQDSVKIILYQGWISDNRGIKGIVEAAENFSHGIVLVLVGYGDYEEVLKRIVIEKQLQDRVFFYGGVPSEDLHALTCDADIGIIPYHGVDENNFYCSPNKLFEFAIAELPFLCNDLPYLHDVVSRYENGFLTDLSSPEKISDAVNIILSDHSKIELLRAGAQRARKELNWDIEEQKLYEIYNAVISNQ